MFCIRFTDIFTRIGDFPVALWFWSDRFVPTLVRGPNLLDHHDNASACNEQSAQDYPGACRFFQQQECEKDGHDDTQFVDGCDTRYVSRLQRLEVEQPGEACGDPRQDEEEPRISTDVADAGTLMFSDHDSPGQQEDDRGTYGRSQIRMDILHTDFCEDGCQCGEQGREQGVIFPHDCIVWIVMLCRDFSGSSVAAGQEKNATRRPH